MKIATRQKKKKKKITENLKNFYQSTKQNQTADHLIFNGSKID